MVVKKIINDRQRARKTYGFVQRLPDRVSAEASSAESDASVLKLDWKESVRFASTANVSLPPGSILAPIDGPSLANGDRILLKNQATTSENGIYVVNTTTNTWDRALDAIPGTTLTCGATTYVEDGTANGGTKWILSTLNVTLGGPQAWGPFDAAASAAGSTSEVQYNTGGAFDASANFTFTAGTSTLAVTGTLGMMGNVLPSIDRTYNLGSSAFRWSNVYTGDLHLKNDRGDWTVVEEEDYLTLRNNKTQKIFKILIEPVDQ